MITLLAGGWIAAIIIAAVILIIIVWYIGVMNQLRQLELKVHEAESGIDVALTKRFDMLTKMLETTKGYAKHEAETLENVVKWRQGIPQNATLKEKEDFLGQLNQVASGINVVVEKYPDLKANTVFLELQSAVANTEEHLQAARRLYNANVTRINHIIVTFPQSIVANAIHMEKKPYFEAEDRKRQDVEFKF
ncbi:MAG: LemA family protein [Candidatus Izemoplasmatales bacterium]|jgi:LemA protein|nr:LemA family protein [Candidatus Izemoplasmatales bacterium]MDD4354635.1 LemA family protein [Candidatus Izemoplasmatales bacterium]MDD4987346.1 LemA family protein [Candidatus Izemoplasmatales bacterium]MDY0373025.1 LemA family protein [Candidatus Izemoplasmatales bacterium]NLF48237.1 LemA family protein [Acholeplasmataceae bacterium]